MPAFLAKLTNYAALMLSPLSTKEMKLAPHSMMLSLSRKPLWPSSCPDTNIFLPLPTIAKPVSRLSNAKLTRRMNMFSKLNVNTPNYTEKEKPLKGRSPLLKLSCRTPHPFSRLLAKRAITIRKTMKNALWLSKNISPI